MKHIIIAIINSVILIGLFISGGIVGWLGNDIWNYYSNKRILNGMFIPHANSQRNAEDFAEKFDTSDSWVCVNVKGMDGEDILSTCKHECGHYAFHEMIAQECEKDLERCADLLTVWKEGVEK